MPKKSKSKLKRSRSRTKHSVNDKTISNDNKFIQNKLKDKYILKLKDYFLFSECMFYNKEFLNWHHDIPTIEQKNYTCFVDIQLKLNNYLNWKKFNYHKLIGQGSFGKGFISSLNNKYFKIDSLKYCLVKMIGARKDEDLQNHYSQLINERDSLIRLGGLWTPKLYCCFIDRQLASIFVQEFIDGETITYVKKLIKIDNGTDIYGILLNTITDKSLIDKIPPINQRQYEIIQFYIAELLSAIKFIHNQGVLHRDLKENNILLTCQGHIKLIDFGLSKRKCRCSNKGDYKSKCSTSHLLNAYVSSVNRLWGNRYYAAPEYIDGIRTSFDDRGDYWAIGIVLFHLLFGCRPFKQIIRNKLIELSHFISNWKTETFLTEPYIHQRCKNHPELAQVFFKLITDFDNRLHDSSIDNKTKKWLPMSWDIFKNFDIDYMYKAQPPIKIPSNKKIYTESNLLNFDTITQMFTPDKYVEHLDCPYFNFITSTNNELFEDITLVKE